MRDRAAAPARRRTGEPPALFENNLQEFQLADLQLSFFCRGCVDFKSRFADSFAVQFHAALRDQTARLGFRRGEFDLRHQVDQFDIPRGGFNYARFDLGRCLTFAEAAYEFVYGAFGFDSRMEIVDEFFRQIGFDVARMARARFDV